MRQARGFTLIEIMLAVAILGIIAGIAVQFYKNHIGEARIGTAIKDIRQAEVVLNDLAMDNNLGSLDGNSGAMLGLYLDSGSVVLQDPTTADTATVKRWLDPWGGVYRYQRDTGTNGGVRTDSGGTVTNVAGASGSLAPQSYDLFSLGPDGVQSGDDVVRGCNGSFAGLHEDLSVC